MTITLAKSFKLLIQTDGNIENTYDTAVSMASGTEQLDHNNTKKQCTNNNE